MTPQLPELRGTAQSTFEYQLAIKNDSGKKLLVGLARAGAAELRDLVHRAVRQPGAQRRADRSRPVQGREAEGAPADHGRRRPAIRSRCASPPRMRPPRPTLVLDITGQPKLDITGREGVLSARGRCRGGNHDPGRWSPIPAPRRPSRSSSSGSAPSGWKVDVRAEGDRSHRAQREQGSAGAGHADRQGDRRRLRDLDARLRARRVRRRRLSASRSRPRRMWGIAGVGIIGIALLVMVGAVARFGRR